MALTFQQKIEANTKIATNSSDSGSTSAAITSGELDQLILDGMKDVGTKVLKLKPEESWKFSIEQSFNDFYDMTNIWNANNHTTLADIVEVYRFDSYYVEGHHYGTKRFSCERVPASLSHEIINPDSIHFRSRYNPCYYLQNNMLYILPEGTGIFACRHYGDFPSGTLPHDATEIGNFPSEYQHLVVLYASYRALMSAMQFLTQGLPTDVAAYSSPDVSLSSISYSAASTSTNVTAVTLSLIHI